MHVLHQLTSPSSRVTRRLSATLFKTMKTHFYLISIMLCFFVLTEGCYRPFDEEWEMFTPGRRYRGICRTRGHECAISCKSEGKRGGRCVLMGNFFWTCTCMCYRNEYTELVLSEEAAQVTPQQLDKLNGAIDPETSKNDILANTRLPG